jgi:hypothetical protein
MPVPRRSSWRFEEDDGADLRWALLAREAAKLAPGPSPGIPPPLSRHVVPVVGLVADARDLAAGQWAAWWQRLIAVKAAEARPPYRSDRDHDVGNWLRASGERFAAVFDPPQFTSLESAPELRTTVRASFAVGREVPHEPYWDESPGYFDYDIVRSTAESVAADTGVSSGEIDGVAHVLPVQGIWWHLPGPGCVLCSSAAAIDPVSAAEVLRTVFLSRLS